jgi:hypothetical protein
MRSHEKTGKVKNTKKKKKKKKKNVLKTESFVRAAKNKNMSMEKGYLPNWTDEIFQIAKHIPKKQDVYRLVDYKQNPVEGVWYAPELQNVNKTAETIYRIDEILKHRKRRGIKEVLVSWKGYTAEHNSWIPESDLLDDE